MPQTLNSQQKAMAWLERFAQAVDADPEIIDAMPIEDVRAELTALGADVKGFHARLARTLKTNPVGEFLSNIRIPENEWKKQIVWAIEETAQALTATSQCVTTKKEFDTHLGKIEVACTWGKEGDDETVFMRLDWNSQLRAAGLFRIRLLNAVTQQPLYEIDAETIQAENHQTFNAIEELHFNPLSEKLALLIALVEAAS